MKRINISILFAKCTVLDVTNTVLIEKSVLSGLRYNVFQKPFLPIIPQLYNFLLLYCNTLFPFTPDSYFL